MQLFRLRLSMANETAMMMAMHFECSLILLND